MFKIIMRQALEYAVDLDIIESNPMKGLKIDKKDFQKRAKEA